MKSAQLPGEMAKMLERIAPRAPKTLEALQEWMGLGYGSGGGNGRSSGISRPTERVALTALERRAKGQPRDRFALDHAQIEADLMTAYLALKRVDATIDRNQVLPAGVVQPEEGCLPCSQVKDPETGKAHERGHQDIYVRRALREDGPKIPLCSWHVQFLEQYGEEPNQNVTLYHLNHVRVTARVVRELQPEAFQRAQQSMRARPLGLTRLELRQESA